MGGTGDRQAGYVRGNSMQYSNISNTELCLAAFSLGYIIVASPSVSHMNVSVLENEKYPKCQRLKGFV